MRTRIRDATIVGAVIMTMTLVATVTADPGQRGRPTQPAAQNAGAEANGRTVYTKSGCDTCHGPAGSGTAAAPRIAATALPLQGFISYVRKPAATMPPQSAQMVSDRDLTDIYAFLHSPAAQAVQANPAAPQAAL